MGMSYLLDSVACVGYLRNKAPKTIKRLHETPFSEVFISSIVMFEMFAGAERCSDPATEMKKITEFVRSFTRVPFNDDCAAAAARVRYYLESRGEKIGPYDTLIAATALHYGFTIVTGNIGEFQRVPNLKVEDWEA